MSSLPELWSRRLTGYLPALESSKATTFKKRRPQFLTNRLFRDQIEQRFQKQVRDAILPYTPQSEIAPLRGFVAGGDGGGYAFGGTDFYLNILNTDDIIDAKQTLIHEAFHGVLGAVYQEDTAQWKKGNAKPADLVRGQFCSNSAELFMEMRNEGTATFVAPDELLKDSVGATGKRVPSEFVYYNGRLADSAALLEVSIASMEAPHPVPLKTVYNVRRFGHWLKPRKWLF